MSDKVRLTRPELRKQRDNLDRYNRFLPTLKLKKQLLQAEMVKLKGLHDEAKGAYMQSRGILENASSYLGADLQLDVKTLASVKDIKEKRNNVAGIQLDEIEAVSFENIEYDLFSTPAYIDTLKEQLRETTTRFKQFTRMTELVEIMAKEIRVVTQRVNLFEKLLIPRTLENIRKIVIFLGDERTASVVRAKATKGKSKKKKAIAEAARLEAAK